MLLTSRRSVCGVYTCMCKHGNIQKLCTENDLLITRFSDKSTKARSATDSDIGIALCSTTGDANYLHGASEGEGFSTPAIMQL